MLLRASLFASVLPIASFGAVAAVALVGAVTPACTVTELDDDDDDDDDGGEGEGEGGEGEGEGNVVPGPEDNEVACSDGGDNDGNGFVDCLDFDCEDTEACSEQICDDGIDDNNNTFTDCADFACDDDPACAEDCDDGIDNDGDNRIDCEDGICNGAAGGPRDPACDVGVVEIQQIQTEEVTVGTLASIEQVFVTAVNTSSSGNISMFVQEPDGEGADYPRFAGLGVFVSSGSVASLAGVADVAIGDCINLSGEVDEFNGLTQLSFITAFSVAADCGTAPSPTVVTLASIATDADPVTAMAQAGVDAEALEGVLVTVEQVTASTASDENGWDVVDVDGARLEVSDFLLGASAPAVAVDDAFASLTGVLSRFNAFFQLQPRNAGDIQQ